MLHIRPPTTLSFDLGNPLALCKSCYANECAVAKKHLSSKQDVLYGAKAPENLGRSR